MAEEENQSGSSYITDDEQVRQHKELVSTLKNEGQLIRNRGTNSLKSVKIEVGKFDSVFAAIRSKLKEQSFAMDDLVETQKLSLDVEQKEIDRQRRLERIQSVDKTLSEGKTKAKKVEARPDVASTNASSFSGFMSRIGPGLGGFIGAGLGAAATMLSGPGLAGLVLRGIPLVTLAPLIGEFIGDFTKAGLSGLLERGLAEGETLSEAQTSFIDSFSSSAGTVAIWAALGRIFGRRMALIFGVAGLGSELISPAIERLLDRTGFSENGIIEAFGEEWDAEKVSKGIGAAMAGITATALISGGLWRRIGIPGLVIGGVLAFSEPLKEWLENRGLPEGFADMAVNVAGAGLTGWTLARMFITRAGLPGAVIGIGLLLGSTLYDWFQKRRAEAVKQVHDELENIDPLDLSETISEQGAIAAVPNLGALRGGPEAASALGDVLSQLDLDEILNRIRQNPEDLSHRVALDSKIADVLERLRDGEIEETIANQIMNRVSSSLQMTLRLADQDPDIQSLSPDTVEDLEGIIEYLPTFKQGSKGFEDFGSGSLAMLHGIEAVVPRQTSAGEVVATMFDENFEPNFEINTERMTPILERISNHAHSTSANIVFAPTNVSPVTTVQKGGSSVSSVKQTSVTSIGAGSGGSGLGRFAN